jgi:hypothetical protein
VTYVPATTTTATFVTTTTTAVISAVATTTAVNSVAAQEDNFASREDMTIEETSITAKEGNFITI